MFPPVELLSFPLIQFCDDVSKGAIDPGNNHCKVEQMLATITIFVLNSFFRPKQKQNNCLKRCDFTMLNSIHTAVSNLYGFIQGDKRCLQIGSK